MRVRTLLEHVNAATAAMLVSHHSDNPTEEMEEDTTWTFEPSKGNVVFCLAFYRWGFTVLSLARALFCSKEMLIKPIMLKQYSFGDFKYKDGKVGKWKQNGEALPIFAELALQPLWDIHEHVAASSAANLAAFARKFQDARPGGMEGLLKMMQRGGTGPQILAIVVEMQDILFQTSSSSEEAVLRSL